MGYIREETESADGIVRVLVVERETSEQYEPWRIIRLHLEDGDRLSPRDLRKLGRFLSSEGRRIGKEYTSSGRRRKG